MAAALGYGSRCSPPGSTSGRQPSAQRGSALPYGPAPSRPQHNSRHMTFACPSPRGVGGDPGRWITHAVGGPGGPQSDDDAPPKTSMNALEQVIKRKQRQLEATFHEMGMEAMDDRLQNAASLPANPPYRLSTLIAETVPRGHAVLVFDIARPHPDATPQELGDLAKAYVRAGATALVVRTDSDDTPSGLRDLWSVTQAVKVPVIARDWLLHPLQLCDIKESGAAGALGLISQVTGKGTGVMSSFGAAMGLDVPVEVVNSREVQALAQQGVVFYAINVSVGLSIAMPGFANKIAHGLLGELPFGAISLVGVRSLEEAGAARRSGADALLIKKEMLEEYKDNLQAMGDALQYAAAGDD